MRARLIAKIMACAALVCLTGSGQAAPVKFSLRNGHLIIVPVTINGLEPHEFLPYEFLPYEFLLDTGASTTLVTPEFARRLGLRPIDRIELVTVAGSQLLVRTQLGSVALGGQRASGVEALISELREVRAAAPGVVGVLGQNFLAQFNYLIDYGAQQLEFETGAEPRLYGARLPLAEHAGRWLVTAPMGIKSLRFVPDTALATLMLFARGELALDWSPDPAEAQLARTDLGSRRVQQRRLRRWQLGPVTFTDLPVIVLAAEQAGAGRSEDGLLPLCLFQRVYFNHRRGYLILQPKPGV